MPESIGLSLLNLAHFFNQSILHLLRLGTERGDRGDEEGQGRYGHTKGKTVYTTVSIA